MEENIEIYCKNDSDKTTNCILFGHREFFNHANFGSGREIIISQNNPTKSYIELLMDTKEKPIKSSSIRISSKNPTQLMQVIQVNKSIGDERQSVPILTASYISPLLGLQINGEGEYYIDIPYCPEIDENTHLSTSILPSSYLKIELIS